MEVKSRKYFFDVWAGVGLILFLVAWNLPWRFQVNDDVMMMWLVSGAYTGEPESFAVFIHPILSWTFSKAYTFAPNIPWYPLTWFGIVFISYLLILKKVAEISSCTRWKHFLTGFVLIAAIHFCFFLQFTIVAGFATLASLLITGSSQNTFSKPVKIIALVLLVFALMIRWESMVLVGLGFLLYNILFLTKSEFRSVSRIFLFLSIAIGLTISSKIFWENNSEYSDFMAFNKARASVIDHPVFYELVRSNQIEKGTAWFFFANWMFDDDIIQVSDLKMKKKELDKGLFSFTHAVNSLKRLVSVQKTEVFKTFLSVLLLLINLIYSSNRRKMIAFTGIWLLFMVVFNMFFILNGRVTILFFLVFLFPLLNYSNFPTYQIFKFRIAYLILFSFFVVHILNFLEEARIRKILYREFQSLLETIPEGEVVILEGYYEHNFYLDYSLNTKVPILCLGWISRSPFQKKALNKVGISSLKDADHFSLFGFVVQKDSLNLPEYMNSIGQPFELKEVIEKSNFVLMRFSRD